MKQYIFLLLLLPFLNACNKDDNDNNRNPYLPDYNFSIDIDMNLPLYSGLNFDANPVFVNQAGIGINGVWVTKTGSGYTAFEATCPNQPITECSILTRDGIILTCPCDGVEFNLFTGLGNGGRYPLKSYRAQLVSQNIVRISN